MPTVITHPDYRLHTFPDHPENASRLVAIESALDAAGLRERLTFLEPQPALPAQILRVHTEEYFAALEQVMSKAPGYIDYAPTYIVPESFRVARLAAGGLIRAVDAMIDAGRGAPAGRLSENNAALSPVPPP